MLEIPKRTFARWRMGPLRCLRLLGRRGGRRSRCVRVHRADIALLLRFPPQRSTLYRDRILYTERELAGILRVSERTVRSWVARAELKAQPDGTFHARDVATFLRVHMTDDRHAP